MSDINPDRPEGHGFGLVIPLTVCKSAGGVFDDNAFVHGFDVGVLHTEMRILAELGATPCARFVKSGILDQIDLSAMHYGYVIKRGETEEAAGWVHVSFTRPDPHAAVGDA